jgi:ankyrin repeat protein
MPQGAIVQTLLDGGADVDAVNSFGETALHLLIVNWGAPHDRVPMQHTLLSGRNSAVAGDAKGVADDGIDGNEDASGRARACMQTLTRLTSAGADSGARDRFGQTPLLLAVRAHLLTAAEHLLRSQPFAAGAEVCASDAEGRTALLLASGRPDFIQILGNRLLAAGAWSMLLFVLLLLLLLFLFSFSFSFSFSFCCCCCCCCSCCTSRIV